ncbi:dolichol-phosphate-mannose synthase family protein [Cardiosporidium cionae]|uniref:Dolichol-phosphate mannosyltransferase subunit 1 n=1 Tax=Cardiosporidium cionae TaxID=476202 RepID=A0ABQ7JAG4_9APIC|nr:dolichol-phosphate-mannose synthase family protein [Cardiosporidium cionae]|eukprot:KAF8821003.1 dolichol-phosphate-mannose synthase family protein [Cardiosporidium cionae]
MARNQSLPLYSILVPTYNEAESLPLLTVSLIQHLRGHLDFRYEIIVIDDKSPDGSAQIFKAIQSLYPEESLILVEREGKLGLVKKQNSVCTSYILTTGTAYIAGLEKAKGEFVILMDADFSHHPKFIPHFITEQKKRNYDIITGSRYSPGGGIFGWNLNRILTSCVANFLARTLLNVPLNDFTGSFRLFRRDSLEIILKEVISKGYVFQLEIIVRAYKNKMTIGEVPITFIDRLYGESKLDGNEILNYLKVLLTLFWTL